MNVNVSYFTLHTKNIIYLFLQYAPLLWTIPVMVPLIHLTHTMGVYTTLAVAVERAATFIPWIGKVSEWV